MDLMICLSGEPGELQFLPEIAALGAGIELGSYGMVGVQSNDAWDTRLQEHKALRDLFRGDVAVHGPFIGMEYSHIDHLIRDVVGRRLDMTLDAALQLRASRVVLHPGYAGEVDLWQLQDIWLEGSIAFWRREITRWADAGVQVVLENDIQRSPDLLIQLVDEVDSPCFGLCMDIGHHHLFSRTPAEEWVQKIGSRLNHVHLHDNDGTVDYHWSPGRGTIDLKNFLRAIDRYAPTAAISLEVEDSVEVQMRDLRKLAALLS